MPHRLRQRYARSFDDDGRPRPLATEDDIRACYRLFLGREPDASGWRTYAGFLHERPLPVDELVGYFIASQEFRDRLHRTLGYSEGAPVPVELEGFTLYVRPDDEAVGAGMRRDRAYEVEVTAAIRRFLAPGDVFVDVGASVGYYTVLAARIVGADGHVHAFEPGPQNQSLLLLNVRSNRLENVTLHRVAAGDRRDVGVYDASGGNGFVGPFDGDPAALAVHELVETTTLDDALGDGRVDVVKVDVEGAEGLVLRGARALLARRQPVVVFEFSPPSLEAISGVTGEGLLGELGELGYRFSLLTAGHDPDRELGPREVLDAFEASGVHHVDVLARPR